MNLKIKIPNSLTELSDKAHALNNLTINELSKMLNLKIPDNIKNHKGWLGNMIELYFGIKPNNIAMPDFNHLGIEMKTLPVNKNYKPTESTYVCTAAADSDILNWYDSLTYAKLKHVLWIPIEADKTIPFAQRRIKKPFLWQPNQDILKILQQDWEELLEAYLCPSYNNLTAELGTYLQLRPKAANSRMLVNNLNIMGEREPMVPKGFYLRTKLTFSILQSQII